MTILEQVKAAVIEAMKAKAQVRLDVARMTQAALQNRQIEKGDELSETEAEKVVATAIKQRREAEEQFRQGGREELADKEAEERIFLESLLPPPLTDAELLTQVQQVVTTVGAAGPQDFGKVMKPVMAAVGTRADGAAVKKIVQQVLESA